MLNQHLRLVAPWTTPAAALTILLATSALTQEEHAHQALSKVHFPVTCQAEAQITFDEATKLHGQLIETIGAADPTRPEVTMAKTFVAGLR
jgi:hypothetical protein